MNQKKKIDMTTGSIMGKVFLFAVPIIIGSVLQQLYTTVDTLIIGNYCGETSLAAVGTSAQPIEVILCLFLGIGSGVSILVSQYTGAGDDNKLFKILEASTFFVYFAGVPICIIGYIVAPLFLNYMQVPADTFDLALVYTRIILIGSLGNIGYNMNAGILRGMGDSKASLWFLIVSCFTNIILDIVFVAFFKWDVKGAAIATTIAIYLSWVISIIYILKKFPEYNFPIFTAHFDGAELKRIMKIGLPIGFNNSLFCLGHVALQVLVNLQGADFMAGVSVASRITGLSNIAIAALSQAGTTFSGQNYGAKNTERLRKGYIKIPAISGGITILMGLVVIYFRVPITHLFTRDDMVVFYAARYVLVLLLSQWMFAVFNAISCIVNGVGLIKYTTIINLLMLWAVRVPVAILINRFFDGTYVMLCYPVSFFFGMSMMIGYYMFSNKWKRIIKGEAIA